MTTFTQDLQTTNLTINTQDAIGRVSRSTSSSNIFQPLNKTQNPKHQILKQVHKFNFLIQGII